MFGFFKKGKKGGKAAPGTDKPGREELLARAHAAAAAAREEIGDETLEKIRAAMMKKQGSAFEQAKATIKGMDRERIADNIRHVIDEDKKK